MRQKIERYITAIDDMLHGLEKAQHISGEAPSRDTIVFYNRLSEFRVLLTREGDNEILNRQLAFKDGRLVPIPRAPGEMFHGWEKEDRSECPPRFWVGPPGKDAVLCGGAHHNGPEIMSLEREAIINAGVFPKQDPRGIVNWNARCKIDEVLEKKETKEMEYKLLRPISTARLAIDQACREELAAWAREYGDAKIETITEIIIRRWEGRNGWISFLEEKGYIEKVEEKVKPGMTATWRGHTFFVIGNTLGTALYWLSNDYPDGLYTIVCHMAPDISTEEAIAMLADRLPGHDAPEWSGS